MHCQWSQRYNNLVNYIKSRYFLRFNKHCGVNIQSTKEKIMLIFFGKSEFCSNFAQKFSKQEMIYPDNLNKDRI